MTTRERPILFSGPMVRAIIENRKTQTRRIVKNPKASCVDIQQAEWVKRCSNANGHTGCYSFMRSLSEKPMPQKQWASNSIAIDTLRSPYGVPGDRLWVREQFYLDLLPWADGGSLKVQPDEELLFDCLYYRADGGCCEQIPECACAEVGKTRWRPSIHMPRWASRINLEVTGVRVERLQEITEADAKAEGVCPRLTFGEEMKGSVELFVDLWHTIHKEDGPNGWDANPWVWVYEFRRI